MNKLYQTRSHYNNKILDILRQYVDNCPEMRFGQIIFNLGIVQRTENGIMDPFFEESEKMYNRIIGE
jgi:hypothetical protein